MVGFKVNRNKRYQCNFCSRPAYVTEMGIADHLNTKHPLKYAIAKKDAEIERLKAAPPKVVTKERVVYKEKPNPDYWYVNTVGIAGIYCTTDKRVQRNVGIPIGQTIENTPCSKCGNRTLLPVVEVV